MSNDNEIKEEIEKIIAWYISGDEYSESSKSDWVKVDSYITQILKKREADKARIAELEAKVQENKSLEELIGETTQKAIDDLWAENQELKAKLERLKSQILILEHVEGMAKIWIDYYALECGTPEEIEMQQLFDAAEFELNMHFYGHYKAGEITLNNITKALNDD